MTGRGATVCAGMRVTGVGDDFDLVALADVLAEIARATRNPEAGRRLIAVVGQLLAQAGLPPAPPGGGDPPGFRLREAACGPA